LTNKISKIQKIKTRTQKADRVPKKQKRFKYDRKADTINIFKTFKKIEKQIKQENPIITS